MHDLIKDKHGELIHPTDEESEILTEQAQSVTKPAPPAPALLDASTNRAFLDDDRVKKIIKLFSLGMPEDKIVNVVNGLSRESIHEWRMIAINLQYTEKGRQRTASSMRRLPKVERRLLEVVKKINDAETGYIEMVGIAHQQLMIGVPGAEGKREKAVGDPKIVSQAMLQITGEVKTSHGKTRSAPSVFIQSNATGGVKVNPLYSDSPEALEPEADE